MCARGRRDCPLEQKGAVTHNATRRHELAHHRQGGPVCPGGGPVEASKVPRPRPRPPCDRRAPPVARRPGRATRRARSLAVRRGRLGGAPGYFRPGRPEVHPAPVQQRQPPRPPYHLLPRLRLLVSFRPHQEALETQRRRRASEAAPASHVPPRSGPPPSPSSRARPRGADGCGIAGADRAVAVWRQRRRSLAAGLGARGALGGRCAKVAGSARRPGQRRELAAWAPP